MSQHYPRSVRMRRRKRAKQLNLFIGPKTQRGIARLRNQYGLVTCGQAEAAAKAAAYKAAP